MSPALPLSQPRTLVFLAYPQMGLLDLTGAQTVFWPPPRPWQNAACRVT